MDFYRDYFFSTHQITIPPLTCFLSRIFRPDLFQSMRQECDTWMLRHFNPSNSEYQAKLLLQSQFPLLVDAYFGEGSRARVHRVAKVVVWLFAIDDITDDQVDGVGSNPYAAATLFQDLVDALELAKTDLRYQQQLPSLKLHKFLEVALECWNEILPDLSFNQHSRIIQAFRDTFEAWQAQIYSRRAQISPDFSTYVHRRRKTSILHVAFVLLEYALAIELDDHTLSNELICHLHNALIDHISWVNDVMSLKAEYSRGEFDNMPSVLCANEFQDFQISVDIVSKMISERDNAFVRIRNEILDSKELMAKPGVKRYVDSLSNWMPGNLHFSYVSARYHGVDNIPSPIDVPLQIVLIPRGKGSHDDRKPP